MIEESFNVIDFETWNIKNINISDYNKNIKDIIEKKGQYSSKICKRFHQFLCLYNKL